MLDSHTAPCLQQPTSEAVRDLLRVIAERHKANVNDLVLDAVKVGTSLQVVVLDHAAGTIDRLDPKDEHALFVQVEGLLDGTARAATINASHTRLGRIGPQ